MEIVTGGGRLEGRVEAVGGIKLRCGTFPQFALPTYGSYDLVMRTFLQRDQ